MFRLADYIVQVVFIGFLVFGLFFLPGVALGDEVVEPAAVGIAPASGFHLIAAKIPVQALWSSTDGVWVETGKVIVNYLFKPVIAVIGIAISIWLVWMMVKMLLFRWLVSSDRNKS